MKLIDKLKDNLKEAMLNEVKERKLNDVSTETIGTKNACRAIISMFPELNKKKNEIEDSDIIILAKKYIKEEKTRMLYKIKF